MYKGRINNISSTLRYPVDCTHEALDLQRFATCKGLHLLSLEALSKFSKKLRDDPLTRIKTKSTEALIGCAATGDKDKAKLTAYLQELQRVVGVQEVILDDEEQEEERRDEETSPPTTVGGTAQEETEPDPKEPTNSNASVEDEIEVLPVPNPPTQGV